MSKPKLDRKTLSQIQVRPGSKVRLRRHDSEWVRHADLRHLAADKKRAKQMLLQSVRRLSQAQEVLFAAGSRGVLIILQGMDAAGKDGTIKHVMSGINPQGCQVHSFKQPSVEELRHNFLWRYSAALPARGQISIFNRSYYEDVLVVKVHPEWLKRQHIPASERKPGIWAERYEDLNAFEEHLSRNGIVVLKFFLHISKHEQKRRLLERLNDKDKLWKFSYSDLEERAYWKQYVAAYEKAISATSTPWAPWYMIPADHKWAAHALIGDIITASILGLNLRYPEPSDDVRKHLSDFRRKLEK